MLAQRRVPARGRGEAGLPLAALLLAACAQGETAGPPTVVAVEISAIGPTGDPQLLSVEADYGQAGRDVAELTEFELPVSVELTAPDDAASVTLRVVLTNAGDEITAAGEAAGDVVAGQRNPVEVVLTGSDFSLSGDRPGQTAEHVPSSGRQLARLTSGSLIATWAEPCADGSCAVYGRLIGNDGKPPASPFQLNRSSQPSSNVTAAASPAGFVTVWSAGNRLPVLNTEVNAAAFDDGGLVQSTADALLADSVTYKAVVTACAREDGYATAWEEAVYSEVGAAADTFVRLSTHSGRPATNAVTGDTEAFQVGEQTHSRGSPHAISLAGGGFALVWRDTENVPLPVPGLFLRTFEADGTAIGAADVQVTTYEQGSVAHPLLADAGSGHIALVYQRGTGLGESRTIELVCVDSDSLAVGEPAMITELSGAAGLGPAGVTASVTGDAVAVVWHDCAERGDGNGCGVHLGLARCGEGLVGSPMVVNTHTAGDQKHPSVAAFGDDGYLVIWTDDGGDYPTVRGRVLIPQWQEGT